MSAWTWKRKAARVVLLDQDGRVFLLQARDPADGSKPPWWEIPGGGLDPGETTEQAARRELYEETGIVDARIGPCIWIQHVEFDFGGFHFDQDEWVHVAWVEGPIHGNAAAPAYRPQALEALEQLAFSGGRWWSVEELEESDVPLLPRDLRKLLPPIVAGELPAQPIDIGEEF